MSLHGTIRVNGNRIAEWTAQRIVTGSPNVYECEVVGGIDQIMWRRKFRLEHRYEDGGVSLAAKVLTHAASTPSTATLAHTRAAELERDRQVAADGDDWAERQMTTDDDIDEGNGL